MKTEVTTSELILLIKGKKPEGFNYLYDLYAAKLYGIILKTVNDEKFAQLILRTSLIYACKNINEYPANQKHFFLWLLKLVQQQLMANLREIDRLPDIKIDTTDFGIEPVQDDGPDKNSNVLKFHFVLKGYTYLEMVNGEIVSDKVRKQRIDAEIKLLKTSSLECL